MIGECGRAAARAKPENKASLSATLRLLFPQTVKGGGPLVFFGAFLGLSLQAVNESGPAFSLC